jgi:3-phosphoshikimate 1-carboxyvinyltransferase
MQEQQKHVGTLLVIGLGLIGGSLAAALRDKGFCEKIVAYNRREESLKLAMEVGIIDEYTTDLPTAIAEADLIVIGVPTLSLEPTLEQVKEHAQPQAVITDVASVKGSVVDSALAVYGDIPSRFVPGHPIAGSEKSGVTAADAQLFAEHKVILTPLESTDRKAVDLVSQMWQLTGAEVVEMEVDRHDAILAATSHLPHVLAYTLVNTLLGQEESSEIFRFAAGGFRDFTRIASSDPVMWHDIVLANDQAILSSIDEFSRYLGELRESVVAKDSESLMAFFSQAKDARDRFVRSRPASKKV